MKKLSFSESFGIAALGLYIPPLALPLEELAALRQVDKEKYTVGLGVHEMALTPAEMGVADLAVEAASRALKQWGKPYEKLGLLACGTESALDMSRPLSAWVADRLNLSGAVRSYEVKHACYAGALALRQALEWQLSGAASGRAALVVAADIALYAPLDPGEPTQGAGAVALILEEPTIASIALQSFPYSEPAFDFYRPVGEPFPRVDGKFSLACYNRACIACFDQWLRGDRRRLEELAACCFHTPFPKMVRKGVAALAEHLHLSPDQEEAIFRTQVAPYLTYNRRIGNAYSASLWFSVATALAQIEKGALLSAFSYGSGLGAELLFLKKGAMAKAPWLDDLHRDLQNRRLLTASEYEALRASTLNPALTN